MSCQCTLIFYWQSSIPYFTPYNVLSCLRIHLFHSQSTNRNFTPHNADHFRSITRFISSQRSCQRAIVDMATLVSLSSLCIAFAATLELSFLTSPLHFYLSGSRLDLDISQFERLPPIWTGRYNISIISRCNKVRHNLTWQSAAVGLSTCRRLPTIHTWRMTKKIEKSNEIINIIMSPNFILKVLNE